MNITQYIQDHGLDHIKGDLKIKVKEHPILPLLLLDYHQLDSSRSNEVARTCRGLVVERGTWKVVAQSFKRFFNWGEFPNEAASFNWNDFEARAKLDGTLITLFYYEGWRISTRFSWADDNINNSGNRELITFNDLFWPLLPERLDFLDKSKSYIFELCSIYNKIITLYDDTRVYLLHVSNCSPKEIDEVAVKLRVHRPRKYDVSNLSDIRNVLANLEMNDPTNEGIVICDSNEQRWKLKSQTYVSLHYAKGNHGFRDRDIIPWILQGNKEEFLSYYPEYTNQVETIHKKMEEAWNELEDCWKEVKDIEDRKTLAFALKGRRVSPILFRMKSEGDMSYSNLESLWDVKTITKVLDL